MKTKNFEIINHGIHNEQYFQGCGTAFSSYDYCFTGIGNSASEAYENAQEQAWSCADDDLKKVLEKLPTGRGARMKKRPTVPKKWEDSYFYVSIRLKVEK